MEEFLGDLNLLGQKPSNSDFVYKPVGAGKASHVLVIKEKT